MCFQSYAVYFKHLTILFNSVNAIDQALLGHKHPFAGNNSRKNTLQVISLKL